jgi:ring-1,2-phenylacetyl-CoA epoxidase subunit PaaE
VPDANASPSPLSALGSASDWHPLRVAAIDPDTADAVRVAFEVPDALRERFRFAPGQHVTIRATVTGQELRRPYSIWSGPDDPLLRIAIKHVAGGCFSAWAVDQLRPGITLDVLPPEGGFGVALDPGAARLHVGFAAGSGATPVLAILQAVLAAEPRSRFTLFYGNHDRRSILFADLLDELSQRYADRLAVFHVLSDAPPDQLPADPLLRGRLDEAHVTALLQARLGGQAPDQAYVCGPSGMIDSATAALQAAGLAPGRIHAERFTPAAATPHPTAATRHDPVAVRARITIGGTETEVPVAPGEVVLDAGLRAGLDLPFSCHSGLCATCRAKLTDGQGEMEANDALTPDDEAAGYVLTCQLRPTTPAVAIDYDAATEALFT